MAIRVVLGGLILAVAAPPMWAAALKDAVIFDFAGRFDRATIDFVAGGNLCATAGSAGVRIEIPAGQSEIAYAAVQPRLSIQGDFEITARFEWGNVERPKAGHGAGLKLTVKDARGQGASLQRLWLPDGRHVYSAHQTVATEQGLKQSWELKEAQSRTGGLQLRRIGSLLSWRVADGPGDVYTEIRRGPFLTHDITELRLAAQSGPSPTLVDVSFRRLEVRANAILQEKSGPQPPPGRPLWLAIAVLAVGAAIAVWRYGFGKRRGAPVPSPGA